MRRLAAFALAAACNSTADVDVFAPSTTGACPWMFPVHEEGRRWFYELPDSLSAVTLDVATLGEDPEEPGVYLRRRQWSIFSGPDPRHELVETTINRWRCEDEGAYWLGSDSIGRDSFGEYTESRVPVEVGLTIPAVIEPGDTLFDRPSPAWLTVDGEDRGLHDPETRPCVVGEPDWVTVPYGEFFALPLDCKAGINGKITSWLGADHGWLVRPSGEELVGAVE